MLPLPVKDDAGYAKVYQREFGAGRLAPRMAA